MNPLSKIIIAPTSKSTLKSAASAITNDELVIFPTETLYGLAANPFSIKALQRLIRAKKRPPEKGFIVLIAREQDVYQFTDSLSPTAQKLIDAFWPGPLTLICKKKKGLSPLLTGGKKTIALRYTSHPTAQALIQYAGIPITAPSANISGHPAPRTARAAAHDLATAQYIHIAIDGGMSQSKHPSTIVDVSKKTPHIIRVGVITESRIQKTLI